MTLKCFECGIGEYETITEDYLRPMGKNGTLLVPNVTFLRCTNCGEETIPPESQRLIERFVEESRQRSVDGGMHEPRPPKD